jgi:hypothetical protein
MGKPVVRRPQGRPRYTKLDYIKMDIGKIVWDGMD